MLRIDDTHQGQVLSAYITYALGTPIQLLTHNGQARWFAEPDDWAAVKNQRAVRNVTQPIRFQGQWHDEESGLYYNRHRYYDPQQGRYISQDPIGLRGGTNLYGYVTNPISMVDQLGLSGFGFNSIDAAYGHAAREAHGRLMYPQSQQTGYAIGILMRTEADMKREDLIDADDFFHCVAFCRVAKSDAPDKNSALSYGYLKEVADYVRGRFGLYGDREIRSHQEMLEDNLSDLRVNEYGFSCPPDQSCSDRCGRYIPEDHLKTRARLQEMGYLD
ncbi:RHS repeat-associated core domain-containing protein [Halomonas sp. ISL-106]|nr:MULTISPECIES: RHS repeat-associated core domain-containing protein [unclassified Halomonas]MBT2786314.1 RHS repeat-associated core domain-containing protein [Halomonas sp. ISL-106]MBT2797336.1 RHS repeat-associated core domain-containing protein [Halomonas sp. ISL-104]